jgi:hypothetical protein
MGLAAAGKVLPAPLTTIFFYALIFFGRNIDPDTLPGKSVLSQG